MPRLPLDPRHGTHEPTTTVPRRAPGSVRRTTSVDILRPNGVDAELVLVGRGRDLLTELDGTTRVLDSAAVEATVDYAEAQRVTYLAHLDTVERLAIVAEYKDRVTARHIERMSRYCGVIARGLKLPPGEVELVQHGSRMHDLGKIAVPDLILGKPSALDPREWQVMRQHAAIGANILANSSSQLLQAGQVIALSHHEWWNGAGYPLGLRGEDIPLEGRITAVADVFDALSSKRCYKAALPIDKCFQIMAEERGTHFDPDVFDAFERRREQVVEIQLQYADEE